jgi:hypothetical protein
LDCSPPAASRDYGLQTVSPSSPAREPPILPFTAALHHQQLQIQIQAAAITIKFHRTIILTIAASVINSIQICLYKLNSPTNSF